MAPAHGGHFLWRTPLALFLPEVQRCPFPSRLPAWFDPAPRSTEGKFETGHCRETA